MRGQRVWGVVERALCKIGSTVIVLIWNFSVRNNILVS